MNYGRLVAAAVAAAVVDFIYGGVVYGMILRDQFGQYPSVYRPPEDMSHMPYLICGILLGMIAAAYIYAKGYEGRGGVGEGLRFGAAMGVFVVGYVAIISFAVMNIGRKLTLGLAAAGFVEWLIVGVVIGLVYKPSAGASSRKGGV
jgi:hypothetical protein